MYIHTEKEGSGYFIKSGVWTKPNRSLYKNKKKAHLFTAAAPLTVSYSDTAWLSSLHSCAPTSSCEHRAFYITAPGLRPDPLAVGKSHEDSRCSSVRGRRIFPGQNMQSPVKAVLTNCDWNFRINCLRSCGPVQMRYFQSYACRFCFCSLRCVGRFYLTMVCICVHTTSESVLALGLLFPCTYFYSAPGNNFFLIADRDFEAMMMCFSYKALCRSL